MDSVDSDSDLSTAFVVGRTGEGKDSESLDEVEDREGDTSSVMSSDACSVHVDASEGVEGAVGVIEVMDSGSGTSTMSVHGGEACSGSGCSSVSEGVGLY